VIIRRSWRSGINESTPCRYRYGVKCSPEPSQIAINARHADDRSELMTLEIRMPDQREISIPAALTRQALERVKQSWQL
ncbi:MAG: hypothetical protein WAN75_35945, partial [Xanthobacteraceae bacterium]